MATALWVHRVQLVGSSPLGEVHQEIVPRLRESRLSPEFEELSSDETHYNLSVKLLKRDLSVQIT